MVRRDQIRAFFVCALIWAGATGCNRSPQAEETKYLRRGEARLAKKDYSGALVEFLNASHAAPKDAESYYQIGITYIDSGDLRAGVQALRVAVALNPMHGPAQLKIAQLMTASRNKELMQQAADRLKALLVLAPDNTEANDSLAVAEWQLGDTAQAEKRIEESLEKLPGHLQASVTMARIKLSRKDYAAAEDVLKKAVAMAPQSSRAAVALGQLYVVMRRPVEAQTEFQRALQLDNNNDAALLGLAEIQESGNRIEDAEKTYRRLATLPGNENKLRYTRFLHHIGKRDAALKESEKLARDNPNDPAIRNWLLSVYLDIGRIGQGEALLTAAIKRNPKDADALLRRSEIYRKSGRTADEEKDLQSVLSITPESAEAHFALSRIYSAQNLPKNERQELTQALRSDAGMLVARLALARNLIAANEAKLALETLDGALESQKNTLPLMAERNWALLALNDIQAARPAINEAGLRFGRVPELVLQDGNLKGRERDYEGARRDAEEVLRLDPENLQAALLLAESYAAQNRNAEATEKLRGLATARPKSAPLEDLLGKWYMTFGNAHEARKAFEDAHQRNPKFEAADIAIAELDRRENHFDAARQRLTWVLAANARDLPALLLLGDVEGQAGNRAAAIAKYRAVLELDRSNLFALNNLAYFLAFDNPDEGLAIAQQAVGLAPGDPTVMDTLGWVYYRRGMYSAAASSLRAAMSKQPSAATQYHLAMSYLKAGNQEMGQKEMMAALEQDPTLSKTESGWQ